MGLNETPSGERIHIGFFGRRNAGKSSLVNAVTGQELAIVSEVKGTTTDPVCKSMELLPLGPVMIIDTPGIDDEGELGEKRVGKSRQILNKTDIAVLVVDASAGKGEQEDRLIRIFRRKNIPYLVAYNKTDLNGAEGTEGGRHEIWVSAATGYHIHELKERIAALVSPEGDGRRLAADLIKPSDLVVLVIPVDKAAPKGRLILPQQQVIRDILDTGASAVMCREDELKNVLASLNRAPGLVITDSQVFADVDKIVPENLLLTSFSILFAGYKGDIQTFLHGAKAIASLTENSTVLIAEACAHAPTTEDIGREKIPRLLRQRVGQGLSFTFLRGNDFPQDLSPYDLIIHCGACMFNRRHVIHRIAQANAQGIPISNYGVVLAYLTGILDQVSHT